MVKGHYETDQQLVEPVFIHITKRLRQIAHAINKHSKYLQEKHQITVPQIICLREIYEHGPISFSALTKIVALNNSTVTGIVDRLERQELVQRTRTSADRRQIHIKITDKGVEFLQNTPPPISDQLIDGLKQYSEDEINQIIWAIDQVAILLDTGEQREHR